MHKLDDFIKCAVCKEIRKRKDVIFMSRYKDRWDLRTRQEIAYCRDKPGEHPQAVTWLQDPSYDL